MGFPVVSSTGCFRFPLFRFYEQTAKGDRLTASPLDFRLINTQTPSAESNGNPPNISGC